MSLFPARLLPSFALGGLLACGAATAAPPSLLVLDSESFLRGQLESIDDNMLQWRHQVSGTRFQFPLEQVQRVVFDTEEPDPAIGDVVFSRNGMIIGRLLSLDESVAHIESPVLGALTLPRDELLSARLASSELDSIFGTFPPMSRWTGSGGGAPAEWTLDDGILSFSGRRGESISLDAGLPEAFEMRFDLRWDESSRRTTQFAIQLCTDPGEADQESQDHYHININPNMIFAQRFTPDANRRQIIGRAQTQSFLQGTRSMRVRVIVDRPNMRIHFFINGRNAGSWGDTTPGSTAPLGTGLRLVGSARSPVQLRNFSVHRWNGAFQGDPTPPASYDGSKDRIDILHGGGGSDQVINGDIVAIRTDESGTRQLHIRTPHVRAGNAIPVDVNVIRQVYFAKPEAAGDPDADAEGSPADRRPVIDFRDGTRIPVTIESADGSGVTIVPDGGDAVLVPMNRIIRIEFPEPPPPPADAANGAGDGDGEDDDAVEVRD